jgi:NADH:ubiquinone oxidoreductase subunit 6 (subunit J)
MSLSDTLFWVMAVFTVVAGVMILFSPSIVRMAFWLLGSLAGFAGLYLLLGADFLGFAQILIYIGGILILFLFGVMLTHRGDVPVRQSVSWRVLLPGVIAGLGVTALLVVLVGTNGWRVAGPEAVTTLTPVSAADAAGGAPAPPPAPATAEGIGSRFLSTFLLPFEVVSVLLVVAMVGATYIARSRAEEAPPGGGGP